MKRCLTLALGILLSLPLSAAAQLGGVSYTSSADSSARSSAAAAQAAADAAQTDATTALQLSRTYTYHVGLTAAAEAANTRAVTVAVTDRNLDPTTGTVKLFCELRAADMLPELAGAFRLAETGAGSENSTTAKPALLITTDATGNATLTVTDVAGGSGLTTNLFCEVVGHGGRVHLALTFDGV